MAPPIRSTLRPAKRATPAELAERFKAEQAQMKQDAAERRAAAAERRRATEQEAKPRRRRG